MRNGQVTAEFDFICISDHLVYTGETKAGTELSPKDFKRAELAANLGINKFYFCTVENFSDDCMAKIEIFRENMKKNRIEILVLEKKDLFVN